MFLFSNFLIGSGQRVHLKLLKSSLLLVSLSSNKSYLTGVCNRELLLQLVEEFIFSLDHIWFTSVRVETCLYLDHTVVLASRLASHVAGVAAAGAALHLDAGRPDDEVGGGGIHLAPGDLIDGCPHLTHRWQGLLHHCRGETTQVTDSDQERALRAGLFYTRDTGTIEHLKSVSTMIS